MLGLVVEFLKVVVYLTPPNMIKFVMRPNIFTTNPISFQHFRSINYVEKYRTTSRPEIDSPLLLISSMAQIVYVILPTANAWKKQLSSTRAHV